MVRNVVNHLQSLLNEDELNLLNEANQSKDERLNRLRNFFHTPTIFNKVKESIDPTWLASEIFINGKDYEF